MDLMNELNSMLVARTKSSAMGQIFLAFIATLSAIITDEPLWCYVYLAIIVVLNLLRLLARHTYRNGDRPEMDRWRLKYGVLTIATGLSWGLLSSQLIVERGLMDGLSILIFVMVAGLAAGATAVLTPDRILAHIFILVLLMPLMVALYVRDVFSYLAIQVVMVSNIIFLSMQVRIQNASLWQLISRRNQIRAMEEATMEAILVHDAGMIIEVNKSFEKMFLYAAAEVVGRSIFDFVPPEDRKSDVNDSYNENNIPSERRGLKKNGQVFYIEVIGRWYQDGDRRLRVTCVQDISIRKKAQEAIREREKNALESARLKSDFLANMSHEIRTPLNAIIGITDLVTETANSDLQRKYFRTLKESGESLLNLVNDILDFSKLDEKKIELEKLQFNLASAVEGQVSLLASRAQQKNILLQMFLDPQLPEKVLGDYGRLGQIILNLVSNAIKFTSAGLVSVEARVKEKQEDKVRVRFEVRDTGMGIDEAAKDKLFRPFVQADNSMARKFGGTGLGLSICQRLVELMNGQLGVESTLGEGSTFWFEISFPVVVSTPIAQQYLQKANASYKKFSAVVVRDELPIGDMLESYLRSWDVSADHRFLSEMPVQNYDLIIVASSVYDRLMAEPGVGRSSKRLVIKTDNTGPSVSTENCQVLAMPIRYSDLFNSINDGFGVKEPRQASPILEPAHFTGSRILVAEDNSTNQMIITALLRQLGIQVHTAHNGQEAIDAFVTGGYDLILMDCQMPEVDGYAATEKIRRLEEHMTSKIPIVALTANVLTEDRERCFASGMNDFISKPIRRERLIAVLNKYLVKVPS